LKAEEYNGITTAWVRHDDLYESYGGGLSKPRRLVSDSTCKHNFLDGVPSK
jgi:hypothetical protein